MSVETPSTKQLPSGEALVGKTEDHFDTLARHFRRLITEIDDERLNDLERRLYREGWHEFPPMPLSNRDSYQHLRKMIGQAIAYEVIERRQRSLLSLP